MSQATEIARVFEVQGSPLLGILHLPAGRPRIGLVMVPAGGPQYHVGCCRQLLAWARHFADHGIAVLRFDYRGMGDSGGEFSGFEAIDDDLRGAVDLLQQQVPGVQQVVLWGGCNAASAIMMYAWQDPRVTGFIVSNPWLVNAGEGGVRFLLGHYRDRLTSAAFWRSLLDGRINFRNIAGDISAALRRLLPRPKPAAEVPEQQQAAEEAGSCRPAGVSNIPYTERMLEGVQAFQGKALVVGSGGIVGREFEAHLKASRPWRKAMARSNYQRVILEQAGHTFSDKRSSQLMLETALDWLRAQFSD